MWVARFKLRDDEDIYSPLCIKHHVEFFALPYTNYEKKKSIHLLIGGTLSGIEADKTRFKQDLLEDRRVQSVEIHRDFVLIHAMHPASRERKAEIKVFYHPAFIRLKPVHVSSDGWEYWEVGSVEKEILDQLVRAAKGHYRGELFSMRSERVKNISNLELAPTLSEHQTKALTDALKAGYYDYPRRSSVEKMADKSGVSFSTLHEHLRRAESKVIVHFLKYR